MWFTADAIFRLKKEKTVSITFTKERFLENLVHIEQVGWCTSDKIFQDADRLIASLLLWWYHKHPYALPDALLDLSVLPWHTLKAIGHLMFSQEREMIIRRTAYRDAYTKREWEPWEKAFREDFGEKNLWEHASHTAMCLIHEIETKEKIQGDIIQEFLNFSLSHEMVIPLPRSCPTAFPAREFNDLVWMNWRARELFREEKGLYPNDAGEPTILLSERKRSEGDIVALYISRRDYRDVGDIVVAFGGYAKNPVGDLTGMAWVENMHEKAIPVLALAGFFIDTFKPEELELPVDVLGSLPIDPHT